MKNAQESDSLHGVMKLTRIIPELQQLFSYCNIPGDQANIHVKLIFSNISLQFYSPMDLSPSHEIDLYSFKYFSMQFHGSAMLCTM